MDYIHITILAIAQGLTEFLPVSSSGHLVLLPKLLGFTDPGLEVDAFLHLGTMLAAIIYFREEIYLMLISLLPKKSSFGAFPKNDEIKKIHRKLALGILLASLPAIFIGFNFKDFFETEYIRSIEFVAYMLIAGSILMLISEIFFGKEKNISGLSKKGMFFVGCMQCLALFPGVSRSGSTISAGLLLGLKKDEAARFSFLLGLPVIAGAGLLSLKDLLSAGLGGDLNVPILAWGLLVSFLSGYFAIDFLLKFLKNRSLGWFVLYRIILALYLLYAFQ